MTDVLDFSEISLPAFLLSAPLAMTADEPNNYFMRKRTAAQRRVDRHKAMAQFHALYAFLAARAVVYLLPSTPGLQDQPSVSNLGVVLPHLSQDTVVISRFRTSPRVGEAAPGLAFFSLTHYEVQRPPEFFGEAGTSDQRPVYLEGEADLKHLRDNLYVGAWGMRTSRSGLDWLSASFDMDIIPVHMSDERLFHLDCCVLPVSHEHLIVCREAMDDISIRQLESVAELTDVPLDAAAFGITNCVILDGCILYSTDITELDRKDPDYPVEVDKIERLERIASRLGLRPVPFNLSEFYKSGAALSCLLMRLNYTQDVPPGTVNPSTIKPGGRQS